MIVNLRDPDHKTRRVAADLDRALRSLREDHALWLVDRIRTAPNNKVRAYWRERADAARLRIHDSC